MKLECRDVWFSGVLKDYNNISSQPEEMMEPVFKPGAGFSLVHSTIKRTTAPQ